MMGSKFIRKSIERVGPTVECPRCGERLTAEEITIGQSLVCPQCAPKTPRRRGRRMAAK